MTFIRDVSFRSFILDIIILRIDTNDFHVLFVFIKLMKTHNNTVRIPMGLYFQNSPIKLVIILME